MNVHEQKPQDNTQQSRSGPSLENIPLGPSAPRDNSSQQPEQKGHKKLVVALVILGILWVVTLIIGLLIILGNRNNPKGIGFKHYESLTSLEPYMGAYGLL